MADATAWLERRGLLRAAVTTELGAALRTDDERATDELAEQPFSGLDVADRARLLDTLERPARAVGASGTIPAINPMGAPVIH